MTIPDGWFWYPFCVFKHPSINDPIIIIQFLFSYPILHRCDWALQSVAKGVHVQAVGELEGPQLLHPQYVQQSVVQHSFFLYADV